MAVPEPVKLYEGVPTTSEATLYTAKAPVVLRAVLCSGDATGGTISLSVVPSGGTAGATNRIAQAFPVAAAAVSNVLPQGVSYRLSKGDFISGLQSSGTHITLHLLAESYGEA
jgi:phosphoribosylaminoimidazole (AIR) synthetase